MDSTIAGQASTPWMLFGSEDPYSSQSFQHYGGEALGGGNQYVGGSQLAYAAGPSKQIERFQQLHNTSRPSMRRVQSSGVLSTPSASPYPFHSPSHPTASTSSSTVVRTPRDGQPPSWYPATSESSLSQPPPNPSPYNTSYQTPLAPPPTLYYPPSSSSATSNQQLITPPEEDPRRRRHNSAQPEFSLPPATSSPSKYAASRHLTISVPTAPYQSGPVSQKMAQVPSREEVDQFLVEMTSMLGPETMAAALSPTTMTPPNPLLDPSLFSPVHTTFTPTTSGPSSNVYNVSGVLLDDEDMALLDEQPHSAAPSPIYQYLPTTPPASAPAYRTSFGTQQQYSQGSHQNSIHSWNGPATAPLVKPQEYNNSGATYLSPPSHHQMSMYPEQYRLRSTPSTPEQEAPPLRRHVSAMDLPSRAYGQYASPSPSPSPTSRKNSLGARPPPAVRRASTGGRGKKGGGGISFINYTSSDSSTLLSGVAPSGSSKRKREEDEEAEQRKTRTSPGSSNT